MKKHVCIRIGARLLIMAAILAVLSACGSSQKTCPSCGKKVDKLIKNTDATGVTFEWCEDCWKDYWAIINAKPAETEESKPAESETVPTVEELDAMRLAHKTELESKYGIYQENDRFGVKIGDKSIADPIWQYIECFQYDEKLYYLVTLGDRTGLMDEAGNLIVEPVWQDAYWTYESNSGDTVFNHRQGGMTTFSSQGYIILPEEMYHIDTEKTVPIPKGDVIYLRGSLLVTKQYFQTAKGTVTVYDFRKQETIDSVTSYRTNYYPSPWAKTEEVGDLGFFVETNDHEYDEKKDKKNKDWKPYERYGFYSFDGKTAVKSRDSKPVVFPEYKIVAVCHYDSGPILKKYVKMFDIESGNQISDLSFWVRGKLDENTGLPEIYDVDGQHVMPAQTAPETGKEVYVLINMTGKNVISLPDDITAVEPFAEGLAAVQNKDGKWGYINASGRFVFECQFNDCSPFENGTADAVLNYKKVTINKDGSIIQ